MANFDAALFNGVIEVSGRLCLIMKSFAESGSLNGKEIRLLDYYSIFPGDVGATINVHPAVSIRGMQFGARRNVVHEAASLLDELGFITHKGDSKFALAPDDSLIMANLSTATDYGRLIDASSGYLSDLCSDMGKTKFYERLEARMDELNDESIQQSGYRSHSDMAFLKESYETDIRRLEFMISTSNEFLLRINGVRRDLFNQELNQLFCTVTEKALKELTITRRNLTGLVNMLSEDNHNPVAVNS